MNRILSSKSLQSRHVVHIVNPCNYKQRRENGMPTIITVSDTVMEGKPAVDETAPQGKQNSNSEDDNLPGPSGACLQSWSLRRRQETAMNSRPA